jgi:hypothetical protein
VNNFRWPSLGFLGTGKEYILPLVYLLIPNIVTLGITL